jgi:Uma2 family endonuclease
MSAAPQLTPLEIYLNSSFEPDAEYVDGVIEERPAGEYDHSTWQHAIELWFSRHAAEWAIRVRPELRIQVAPDRFQAPDVTILDRNLPIEQVITHPPIAVFEILSPEDTVARMLTKLKDYEQMGIEAIFLLDPAGQHFRYKAGSLQKLSETAFDLPGSSCRFDLQEIQRLLD